ncbi:MAG: isoprenylcysteine carboxylmethyltransferase family protein [Mycobacterium sp.]|uniref:methyltransferase family protein n=1 Tax=Mycobacterium sp. TaxID=1785 RepID=UPI003BB145C5
MKTVPKVVAFAIVGSVMFGSMLFVPAGTFNYWRAWLFLVVFSLSTLIPSLYLLRTNPAALERRMRTGPVAETRPVQKVVIIVAGLSLVALIVVSVIDHRFGWSPVPTTISLVGDVLVAIGLGVSMLVVIQNGYAASTITVEAGQKLVSTGLYAFVRHPMYTGTIIMMLGTPLALGSYWGLVFVIPGLLGLAVRIDDEEQLLNQELDGYSEYAQKVHYRLVPYVW